MRSTGFFASPLPLEKEGEGGEEGAQEEVEGLGDSGGWGCPATTTLPLPRRDP